MVLCYLPSYDKGGCVGMFNTNTSNNTPLSCNRKSFNMLIEHESNDVILCQQTEIL